MPETRRKYDPEFREGAVRIVRETGTPIAQIARDLGINAGTLGNWAAEDHTEPKVHKDFRPATWRSLKRLRAEVAELRMERDVLKRSVVLWVLSRRHSVEYAEPRIMPSVVLGCLRGKGSAHPASA